jgi:hypothetical protein
MDVMIMKKKYKWIVLEYGSDFKPRDLIITSFNTYNLARKYVKDMKEELKNDTGFITDDFLNYIEFRKIEHHD